eukprot:scaffold65573_cov19-Tisochrysis_lutea.AAC.1
MELRTSEHFPHLVNTRLASRSKMYKVLRFSKLTTSALVQVSALPLLARQLALSQPLSQSHVSHLASLTHVHHHVDQCMSASCITNTGYTTCVIDACQPLASLLYVTHLCHPLPSPTRVIHSRHPPVSATCVNDSFHPFSGCSDVAPREIFFFGILFQLLVQSSCSNAVPKGGHSHRNTHPLLEHSSCFCVAPKEHATTHPCHPLVPIGVPIPVVPHADHEHAGGVGGAKPHGTDGVADPAVVEGHGAEVQPPDVHRKDPNDDRGCLSGALHVFVRGWGRGRG